MTVKESHQNYNRTAEAVIVLPFLRSSSNSEKVNFEDTPKFTDINKIIDYLFAMRRER
jgi:hypothetical protein